MSNFVNEFYDCGTGAIQRIFLITRVTDIYRSVSYDFLLTFHIVIMGLSCAVSEINVCTSNDWEHAWIIRGNAGHLAKHYDECNPRLQCCYFTDVGQMSYAVITSYDDCDSTWTSSRMAVERCWIVVEPYL